MAWGFQAIRKAPQDISAFLMEKFRSVILFNSMECTQESHTEGVILPLKSTAMINMKALSLVLQLLGFVYRR
ncbi:hypothetical protein GA0061071_105153 [Kosakonia oryzendophytica]|uniref:Uncharacterized protein n=1 Tax=Kosakonia oryzendophytica TaxID=1005665 RepID=A0A1C4BLV7_9ENTR|nr:hypothetical protein GA0061071_105153 [Kosakonia oryzendophytica]